MGRERCGAGETRRASVRQSISTRPQEECYHKRRRRARTLYSSSPTPSLSTLSFAQTSPMRARACAMKVSRLSNRTSSAPHCSRGAVGCLVPVAARAAVPVRYPEREGAGEGGRRGSCTRWQEPAPPGAATARPGKGEGARPPRAIGRRVLGLG